MRARDLWLALTLPLLLAAMAGCRSTSPESIEGKGQTVDGQEVEERSPRRPFRQVLPTVAFEMMHDSPTIDVVDVRSISERRREGHINRSQSYPFDLMERDLSGLEALKGRTFLVFDSGAEGDDRARRAVLLLRQEGWREAVLLEGGLASWQRFGFGVVGGTVD